MVALCANPLSQDVPPNLQADDWFLLLITDAYGIRGAGAIILKPYPVGDDRPHLQRPAGAVSMIMLVPRVVGNMRAPAAAEPAPQPGGLRTSR